MTTGLAIGMLMTASNKMVTRPLCVFGFEDLAVVCETRYSRRSSLRPIKDETKARCSCLARTAIARARWQTFGRPPFDSKDSKKDLGRLRRRCRRECLARWKRRIFRNCLLTSAYHIRSQAGRFIIDSCVNRMLVVESAAECI